jgi:hypothetical protein
MALKESIANQLSGALRAEFMRPGGGVHLHSIRREPSSDEGGGYTVAVDACEPLNKRAKFIVRTFVKRELGREAQEPSELRFGL